MTSNQNFEPCYCAKCNGKLPAPCRYYIEPEQRPSNEEVIAAAARVVMRAAVGLIQADPHRWSTRPCQTCRAVTAMIGIDFGCVRYAKERENKA